MSGIQAGVIAFILWGLVPLFWRLLSQYNAWELVAHRAVWSFPLLMGILVFQRRASVFVSALKKPAIWLASGLLAGNWLLYVWLTVNARFIEASLGYFIVPILNTLLGVRFLGELLRPLQKIAVVVALLALLFPLADLHYFPWPSLLIAGLWSGYGFVRKGLKLEGMAALTAETAAIFPLALGFLLWRGSFAVFAVPHEGILLVLTGVVTVLPLIFYGYAVPRLSLTSLGLLQYLGPTITFLLGIFLYHEPMPWHRLGLLTCVWIAIGLYVIDGLRQRKG